MRMKMVSTFPRSLQLQKFFPRRIGYKGKKGRLRTSIVQLRTDWQKLAILGLFGLGIFIGARAVSPAAPQWTQTLAQMLQTQRTERATRSLLANALAYFGTDVLFLTLAFAAGLCAVGLPLALLLPVLRGLGLGAVTGYMMQSYGWQGLGYCMMLVYPAAVVSVLVMLVSGKESILMAGDMLLVAGRKNDKVEVSLRLYALRFLALLLPAALAALLDAVCFNAFSKIFTF